MNEFTRIDPDLPLCWESTETVRIGFEVAVARVRAPSAAAQRLMGLLSTGVRTADLKCEALRVGATPAELSRLLSDLAPALVTERRSPRPLRSASSSVCLAVSDDGRSVSGLRDVLSRLAGIHVIADNRPERADLVVHVERFLEPLERAQRWLMLSLPHLVIRFSDRTVHVGPIVSAAGAPCHSCASLSMVASDPALPVLATQLHGKIPRSECRPATELATVFAARLIDEWREGSPSAHHTRWEIPIVNRMLAGPPAIRPVRPFPECGCSDSLEHDLAGARNQPAAHRHATVTR